MSVTDNLAITYIQQSQNQKEVTMNEAVRVLDGALAGNFLIDLNGLSGDVEPNSESLRSSAVLKITGALANPVNLIVPDQNHIWHVRHLGTDYDIVVKTSAGSGVTLSPTQAQLVYCDSTDVVAISTLGSAGAVYPIPKTKARFTGLGGSSDLSIGTNVDPTSVELYVQGILLDQDVEYEITESSPGSGNYDTIHPLISDIMPAGDSLVFRYYSA